MVLDRWGIEAEIATGYLNMEELKVRYLRDAHMLKDPLAFD